MIGKPYEYDAMASCERHMWWYRCLHDLTIGVIKKNAGPHAGILDAGCGTGGLLLKLKQHGYTNLSGFDLSPDAVTRARSLSGIPVKLLDIGNVLDGYPQNSFDIVTSHDVVCLLEKDREKAIIGQLISLVKPGGLLVMNLPALHAFIGTHDLAVGIQTRYSRATLLELVSGLALVKEIRYWPFVLSPAIFLVRKVQKLLAANKNKQAILSDVKMPPRWINQFFYTITKWENNVFRTKPWGSSLFLVLQKPG